MSYLVTKRINLVCIDFDFEYAYFSEGIRKKISITSDEMLDHSKSLFHTYLMKNIRKCDLSDIEKDKSENFFFVISDWFYKISTYLMEKKRLPLNSEMLEFVRKNPNFKIIICSTSESDIVEMLDYLKVACKFQNINEEQIYVINNNYLLEEWKNKIDTKINVYSTRILAYSHVKWFLNYDIPFLKQKDFLFLFHIRVPKSHRYGLILKLMKHGIINDVDWSAGCGYSFRKNEQKQNDFNKVFFGDVMNIDEINEYQNEIDYLMSIDVKKSKFERHVNWFDLGPNKRPINNNWGDRYVPETYVNSYINITSETMFTKKNFVSITEKSFKPFYFLQLPLFVATPRHIECMKERYGYDFFDDLIDHSYDREFDDYQRFNMIFDEIKRLHQNKEEVKKFYVENKDRFYKNQQITKEIMNDKTDIDYIRRELIKEKV